MIRVSIELSKEEKELANNYAISLGLSLEEAFKRCLFEAIEDEYDAVIADEAYAEYVRGGKKGRLISEFWEEIGL